MRRPGRHFLVSDHVPRDSSVRMTSLHATEQEQHAAPVGAGLEDVRTVVSINGLYVCSSRRASDR